MQSIADIIAEVDDQVVVQAYLLPTTSSDLLDSANNAVAEAGLRPIGDKWHQLPDPPAELLAYHVGHDLAYSSAQLLPVDKCHAIASAFIALTDHDSKWFTNNSEIRQAENGTSQSLCPVSDWTFDSAFVAVGAENTLVICFFAED